MSGVKDFKERCHAVGLYEGDLGDWLVKVEQLTAERDRLRAAAELLLSRKRPGAKEDDPRLILEIDCMNLEEALKGQP